MFYLFYFLLSKLLIRARAWHCAFVRLVYFPFRQLFLHHLRAVRSASPSRSCKSGFCPYGGSILISSFSVVCCPIAVRVCIGLTVPPYTGSTSFFPVLVYAFATIAAIGFRPWLFGDALDYGTQMCPILRAVLTIERS